MRMTILSGSTAFYATKRLMQAGRRLGHTMQTINPLDCDLMIEEGAATIYHKRNKLTRPDIILPRLGSTATEYAVAVTQQFELMGVPTVNTSAAAARAGNKLRAHQFLAKHHIPTPKTILARRPDHIERDLTLLGGPPVILKLLQGTQGVGVMIADSRQGIESILETFWGLGHIILMQQYIKESGGTDVRVLVVGGQVIGAMRRKAQTGQFRANIHRGGVGEIISLTQEEEEIALLATEVMGLDIAGVDLIMSNDGPLVVEVNSSPGFKGFEDAQMAAGMAPNIGELFIQYSERKARKFMPRKKKAARPSTDLRPPTDPEADLIAPVSPDTPIPMQVVTDDHGVPLD
ncbi:MAG TPA: RimK family alpha-L-glutamate ligase [bacterium]|nr:RimK family alpha-L-glutamate ligase [bacterium]